MSAPKKENKPASKNSLEPVTGREKSNDLPGPVRTEGRPLIPHGVSSNSLTTTPPRLPRTPDAISLLQAFRHRWMLALSLSLLAGLVAAATTWYWLPRA